MKTYRYLFLKLSFFFISFSAKKEFQKFELSLKNPDNAQKQLLKSWKKNKCQKEPALYYEYTSGSSGTKKSIPYTKTLRKAFSKMFLIWAYDLIHNSSIKFNTGKIFISISPKIDGLGRVNDDSEYLDFFTRLFLRPFLAIDPKLKSFPNGDQFLKEIASKLAQEKDLEIISVWSPTYLLRIIDVIRNDLKIQSEIKHIWPNLKMISCWDAAESEYNYIKLKNLFSHVWIQPKGLLATEGPMTIPLCFANGEVPLVHLIRFQFLDDKNNILELTNLKINEIYEIIPTFPNNDSPYRIKDLVKCTGFYKNTPTLKFVGRTGDQSDLVGEKLSGPILRELLSKELGRFIAIPIQLENKTPYYVFVSEKKCSSVEEKLLSIYHYKIARELGQLNISLVQHVSNIEEQFFRIAQNNQISLGDLKDYTFIKNQKMLNDYKEWLLTI